MSRYNSVWAETTKLFYDVYFYLVIVPLIATVAVAARIVYGKDDCEYVVNRTICKLTSHHWADSDEWGHRPVCLDCGVER